MGMFDKRSHRKVVGLVPAGGQGKRINPIPCSKEVYPLGFELRSGDENLGVKVACQYLLEKMLLAGIKKVYVILRNGKWDIPNYLGNGERIGMHLAYLLMGLPFGTPYTLDQAYPFVENAIVALGFPDILFDVDDVFLQLLERQNISNADVVLGLFPADQPEKVDMIDVDENGRLRQLIIKPLETDLHYTWGVAVWAPVFTRFMHEYLESTRDSAADRPELFVGDVFQAAVHNNLHVEGFHVSDKPYLDIGTPEDLVKAVRKYCT